MQILLLIALWVVTSGHEITQLHVPLHADPRRAAELSCHFHMHDQKLHSVKWYRDLEEIFRYNPTQKPPIRLFNVTGIMVTGGECQRDESCTVVVLPPPLATRAAYSCEVSTEGPKFLIARQTKFMNVVAMPAEDPVIEGAPQRVAPGEQLLLNCTSDYSLPPAEIHWYIDDELQKPEPWQAAGISSAAVGGLRAAWRALRLRVPTVARGALHVRCEAELRAQPPVRREATITLTVHAGTHRDRYVASCGTQNFVMHDDLFFTLWTVVFLHTILS